MTAFLMRNWQAIFGALAAIVLLFLLDVRTDQRDAARLKAERTQVAFDTFAGGVRLKAVQIAADFADYARRVEGRQTKVSEEVSRDYQARLAVLRADYERRLRNDNGARPGGAGPPPGVPGLPDAAGGPDAGTSPVEEFACEANTLQLEFLQRWIREQQAIDRTTPRSEPED